MGKRSFVCKWYFFFNFYLLFHTVFATYVWHRIRSWFQFHLLILHWYLDYFHNCPPFKTWAVLLELYYIILWHTQSHFSNHFVIEWKWLKVEVFWVLSICAWNRPLNRWCDSMSCFINNETQDAMTPLFIAKPTKISGNTCIYKQWIPITDKLSFLFKLLQ